MSLHNEMKKTNRTASSKRTRVTRLIQAIVLGYLTTGLGGCVFYDYLNLRNSFLNPAEVGRFDKSNPFGLWEVRPVKWPILSQLDVIEEPSDKWANATDPTPADLVVDVREYAFQPGDAIGISIYELLVPGQEYTRQLRVNELGYINIQNVGNIQITGLTPTQVEQKIAQTLVEQKILPAQPGPQVQVTLLESRQKIFSISGAVGHAGPYNIVANDFRLWDAIVMSGDISYQPGMDYLYIIRQEHPATSAAATAAGSNMTGVPGTTPPGSAVTPTRNPAEDLEAIEKMAPATPATKPSGTVPAPSTAPATGPGARGKLPTYLRPIPTAMVLAQADLDAAAGLPGGATAPATAPAATKPADQDLLDKAATSQPGEQVYVDGKWVSVAATQATTAPGMASPVLGPVATTAGAQPGSMEVAASQATTEPATAMQRIIRIPIAPLLEGVSKYNIVVRPGDIIRVPPIDPGEFYLMGNIGRPGVYTLTGRKVTLKMAIAAAGNLGPLAIPRRCDLIRRIGDDQEAIIQVNLQKIFDGEQPDIFLKPNDLVNIGTDAVSPILAVTRNAYRASYGWGFVYDKNLNDAGTNTNNSQITQPTNPTTP